VTSETVAGGALSRAAVEELSMRRAEPDWLRELRLRAFEAFERLPVPDQRTEGWRRTSLRGLPLHDLNPVLGGNGQVVSVDDALPRRASATHVVFHDGARVESVPPGSRVRVLDLREAVADRALVDRVREHFGQVLPFDLDKFTALHYAFFNVGAVVVVPRGAAIEAPVWISYHFDQPDVAPLVHTLVLLDDSSELRLVEDFSGAGTGGVASGVVEQVVGSDAHLRYVHLQRWSTDVWNFSAQRTLLGQNASVRTLNVAIGARMARNTVQVLLEGRGSQADLLGIVDARGRQQVDFETLQEHSGDATRSDLVIHDALRDRTSANFTGLIRINTSARQTESSQEQKNILLSDHARANSDPKLEILNNDVVRCTHGASVGPVDEEMVFYLQARGLDREAAQQLIVNGFFQSVLDKIEHTGLQEAVWSAIADRQA
jgi:Fe-S cluster assembly protein SufD